jgi:hypothetical protein
MSLPISTEAASWIELRDARDFVRVRAEVIRQLPVRVVPQNSVTEDARSCRRLRRVWGYVPQGLEEFVELLFEVRLRLLDLFETFVELFDLLLLRLVALRLLCFLALVLRALFLALTLPLLDLPVDDLVLVLFARLFELDGVELVGVTDAEVFGLGAGGLRLGLGWGWCFQPLVFLAQLRILFGQPLRAFALADRPGFAFLLRLFVVFLACFVCVRLWIRFASRFFLSAWARSADSSA